MNDSDILVNKLASQLKPLLMPVLVLQILRGSSEKSRNEITSELDKLLKSNLNTNSLNEIVDKLLEYKTIEAHKVDNGSGLLNKVLNKAEYKYQITPFGIEVLDKIKDKILAPINLLFN